MTATQTIALSNLAGAIDFGRAPALVAEPTTRLPLSVIVARAMRALDLAVIPALDRATRSCPAISERALWNPRATTT